MKMNQIYQIIILPALIVGLGSCKKWLDVNPKTEIRENSLLRDEAGFKDAVTGVYQLLGSSSLYGQQMTMGFMDAMAQRYNVSSSTHVFYQAARFNYTDAAVKNYHKAFWSDLYAAIANINNVITQIDPMQPAFSGNNFNQLKGEALALRAFMHFDLLRMFGESPAVDKDKPAIPYVTGFDVSVYPLLTVDQIMDSCLKDLSTAEQLLSADKTIREIYNEEPFLSYTRNHFNYWAVKGLQARILLYQGDKAGALAAAMAVIDNQEAYFPFVKATEAAASNNRDRLYVREHLFSLSVYNLKKYTEAYTKTSAVGGTPPLVHTNSNINSLFETSAGGSSDIRFVYQFVLYAGGYGTSKYWQDDIAANNANLDYLRNAVPLIRLSEMYYIAAECSPATEEGVTFLNVIRSHRGLGDLTLSISAENLEKEILKEYKKELYAEGQLFFYFKRKNATRVDGSTRVPDYVFPLPDDEIEFGNR